MLAQGMTAAKTKENPPKSDQTPEYSPKRAFVAEVEAANVRLAEFSIEFTSDKPGMLREVADILAKHKANIRSGFHEFARWSFLRT